MTKKKKISPSWLKKELDKKLYYPFMLFIFLLCVLVAYAYSIPSVGIPIEIQIQVYLQTLIYNLSDNSASLSPTPTPNPPNYYLFKFPSVTPIPQPTPIELPNLNFNKLIIFQTRYTHENTAFFTRVITDQSTIKRLYNDIKNSDFWKPGVYHCPEDNGLEYILNFYANDVLTVHAILNVTGCRGIRFTKYTGRMASSLLIEDLQQTLYISQQEFYGK